MKFYDHIECTKQTLWGAYIPQAVFYIAPVPVPADNLLYFVNRGGIVKQSPPDFCIARHNCYPFTQICCVVSGLGSLQICGKTYPLTPGTLFLLPSYEAHVYSCDPEHPMGMVWLEFGGGDSDRFGKCILEKHGPVFEGDVFKNLLDVCTEFLHKPIHGSESQMSMMVYRILMTLYASQNHASEKKTKMVDEIYSYVDSHLHETIRMADVARHFGYNASYFSSLFSENFGMPFTRYVLQCRITKARYLLTSTDLPLEYIASSLGFYDTSHFIQRFREIEKISPAQYRKSNSGRNEP